MAKGYRNARNEFLKLLPELGQPEAGVTRGQSL